MAKKWMCFLNDEDGASAVEYGLIIGLIAVALVVILGTMGGGLNTLFTTVSNEVTNANTGTAP